MYKRQDDMLFKYDLERKETESKEIPAKFSDEITCIELCESGESGYNFFGMFVFIV